jgi:hypothetical protein
MILNQSIVAGVICFFTYTQVYSLQNFNEDIVEDTTTNGINYTVCLGEAQHTKHKEDDHYRSFIKYQLENLSLNNDNNNALFLGRTEAQGIDLENPGSLVPKDIIDSNTKWVFIDYQNREQLSVNDIVAPIEEVIQIYPNNETDSLAKKFKLIIIDSGVAGYIMSGNLLKKLISWIKPDKASALIFENLPPTIHPTCEIPYQFASECLWERQRKWKQGEKLFIQQFGNNLLSFYPNAQDPFCQIYCNTKRKGKKWCEESIEACSRYFRNSANDWQRIKEEMTDYKKIQHYKDCCDNLKKYFKARQNEKIGQELALYFNNVSLQENLNKNNDAPFVKGKTYNPSNQFFWWVAIRKKD